MAKIAQFPAFDIIAGFKGVLDFYSWKDIKVVRKWPVITGHKSTVREKSNQNAFQHFQGDLKMLRAEVKDLWRGVARLANWRYHEVAYRWYRGEHLGSMYGIGPYTFPLEKPHPRWNPLYFKAYDATWVCHRDLFFIVFMVDSLQPHMSFYHSSRFPHTQEVYRRERGVTKLCGVEPYKYNAGAFYDLEPSFFGEYPPCSWYMPIPHHFAFLHEGDVMQLVCHRGHELGAPTHYPTHPTYSSGPPFILESPPGLIGNTFTHVWRYPLKPIWPLKKTDISPRWGHWYSTYRSWTWPTVPDPEFPYINWERSWPFEDFPIRPGGPYQ